MIVIGKGLSTVSPPIASPSVCRCIILASASTGPGTAPEPGLGGCLATPGVDLKKAHVVAASLPALLSSGTWSSSLNSFSSNNNSFLRNGRSRSNLHRWWDPWHRDSRPCQPPFPAKLSQVIPISICERDRSDRLFLYSL